MCGTPSPIALATLRMVSYTIAFHWVTSPANRTCEWLAARRCTVEPHYSGMSAHLAGYDDATCLHVLQVPR
jgi:hypothetical protein